MNSGYECRSPNMPDDFKSCKGVVAAWGLGGDSFAFPADAGNQNYSFFTLHCLLIDINGQRKFCKIETLNL